MENFNANASLICNIAKECINHGNAVVRSLDLDDYLLNNCSTELMQDICSCGFVRGRMQATLRSDSVAYSNCEMHISADIRCEQDGTLCFEDGDVLLADLSDRADVNVKILKDGKVLFDSASCSSDFFQGKVGWLPFTCLEHQANKCSKRDLLRFQINCKKVLACAELF